VAEALLGRADLVVRWHEDVDQIVITGRAAGPAGSAGVALGDVEVDVDVAEPDQVVAVSVPADDPGRLDPGVSAVLERLVGADAVSIVRAAGPTARRVARGPVSRPLVGRGVDARLATLALALQEVERPGVGAAHTAASLLTAAVAAHRLAVPGGLPAAELAARGAHLLLDAGVPAWPPAAADTLAAVAREVVARNLVDAVTGHHLVRVAGRAGPGSTALPLAARALSLLRPPEPRPASARPAASDATFTPPARLRPRLTVAASSLPGPGFPLPTASWIDDSNVEVRLTGSHGMESHWARAFAASTGVLVAAAPITGAAGHVRARLLVPPLLPLELDVVAHLDAPAPRSTLATVSTALAHGRGAARHERAGNTRAAADEWRAAARFHGDAGDADRSREALARAGHPTRQHLEPLATDHL
jgi:hypothetical protein